MDLDRLRAILDRWPDVNILVVGDFFLDKYLIIEHALAEISLETGLEAHQVVQTRCSPGAAGTVTSNLRAMEVRVRALGVIGDDGEGYELQRALRLTGVDVSGLVVRSDRVTPTYTKPMLQETDGAQHELNRLDIKNRAPMPRDAEDQVIDRLRDLLPHVDGVIVADQVPEAECGVITARVRAEIGALARAYPRVAFIADSRERIGLFGDVMIKPNAREALRAACPDGHEESLPAEEAQEAAALGSGAELYRRSGRPVFLTLAEKGIAVFGEQGMARVPAVAVSGPIDIVGAGDATMAGICSALCAGATPPEAAQVGCLAAAVTIRQIGTTGTASRAQIMECWLGRG
jgi:rfaE bifunctional protein kinase chain/domain